MTVTKNMKGVRIFLTIDETFLSYIKQMTEKNPANSNDYVVDSILFCGYCNTPKRSLLKIDNETVQVPALCKCQREKQDEYKKKEKYREQQREIDRLRQKGISNKLFLSYTLQNDNKHNDKVTSVCIDYVEKFEKMQENNIGLLFYGNVGSGKTFYAVSIANALIDRCIPAKVINFPTVINQLQQTFQKDEYIQELTKYALVVFDDFGVERNTEYVNEQIYTVVNALYEAQKPFIVTSNLTLEDMKKPTNTTNERIYSRILDVCKPIAVTGKSQRDIHAEETTKIAREIFKDNA